MYIRSKHPPPVIDRPKVRSLLECCYLCCWSPEDPKLGLHVNTTYDLVIPSVNFNYSS